MLLKEVAAIAKQKKLIADIAELANWDVVENETYGTLYWNHISYKNFFRPEYKHLAEQTVRDVLGEDTRLILKFISNLSKIMGAPNERTRSWFMFIATPEEILTALVKTVGGE